MQPVDIIISAIKSTSVWTVIATIFIGLCIIVWLYHQFCSWISIQQDSFPITIEVEGSNGVYCNPMLGPEGTLLPFQLKDVNSMYDAFFHGRHFAKLAGDERMLGKQQNEKYVWLTHDMVLSRIKQISSGILKFGLTPGQDTRVGIFAVNCVEWMLTALSCIFQNIVIVPINRYLDDNGIIHIINQCEIEMVFVKTKLEIERIIMLKDKCPTLCTIVSFEKFDFNRLSLSKDNAVETIHLCNLADIERKGLEYTVPFNPPKSADDIIVICYTSGTTGLPKGVILTHRNVLTTVQSFNIIQEPVSLGASEVMLSYLPLAHIFEFVAESIFILRGAKIAYSSGDITKFVDDIKICKPTFLPVIPRVLENIYNKIQTNLEQSSAISRAIFRKAFDRKKAFMLKTGLYRHPVYDRFVFSKIQRILGGNLSFIIVGGAASRSYVIDFMRVVLGSTLVEGYGQTETCSGTICQNVNVFTLDNVGCPIVSVHVKLKPVNDDYFCDDPNIGEVCVRGINVCKGYFRHDDPELFDDEGWLHSGDIARRNKDGSFSIIDRKKEIYKLSQGEYVSPIKVENVYSRLPVISQIIVTGYPHESFSVAIVVPDEVTLRSKINDLKLIDEMDMVSFTDLCKLKGVIDAVQSEMDQHAIAYKLSGIEKARKIYLESSPFSVENLLLTPTLKLKRRYALKFYRSHIDEMYKKKKRVII